MAAIPSLHLPLSGRTRGLARTWLLAACVASAVAGAAVASVVPAPTIDAEVVFLLRAMAGIKALLVVAALAAVTWRFGRPLADRTAIAYGASIAAMSFATVLIALTTCIGIAAVVFHAGLFALLVTAWRDDRLLPARAGR